MTDQIATGNIVLGDEFSEYRMTGYVSHAMRKGMDPKLDCALITHVKDGLWQGGCFNGIQLPEGFDRVYSLYPWEQYLLPEGCERVEHKMYDALDQACDEAVELARRINADLDAGLTVLVHCQAGLNRSGLVTALVLMQQGMAAGDAIRLLREQRSHLVLCNDAFEAFLVGYTWSG
jgi:hypothetical protein